MKKLGFTRTHERFWPPCTHSSIEVMLIVFALADVALFANFALWRHIYEQPQWSSSCWWNGGVQCLV